eukprot:367460_1
MKRGCSLLSVLRNSAHSFQLHCNACTHKCTDNVDRNAANRSFMPSPGRRLKRISVGFVYILQLRIFAGRIFAQTCFQLHRFSSFHSFNLRIVLRQLGLVHCLFIHQLLCSSDF